MKRRILGTIGCVIGLLGVVAAVLAYHVVERAPEQPPGWSIEAELTKKIKLHYGTSLPTEPTQP